MFRPTTRPPASREVDRDEEIEAALRGEVIHMSANSGNANNGVGKWVMGLLQSLTLAGILAVFSVSWMLYGTLTELKTSFNERERSNDREFGRINETLDRHDQRLTNLEQGRRSGEFDADHRQKR